MSEIRKRQSNRMVVCFPAIPIPCLFRRQRRRELLAVAPTIKTPNRTESVGIAMRSTKTHPPLRKRSLFPFFLVCLRYLSRPFIFFDVSVYPGGSFVYPHVLFFFFPVVVLFILSFLCSFPRRSFVYSFVPFPDVVLFILMFFCSFPRHFV